VGAAGLLQQARGVAQVAGDDGPQVGGFGQPLAPALPGGAELGGAQQLGDGADGVAAPQVGVRDLLKERGDPFVGFLGGLGQVPGVSFGLAGQADDELRVGLPPLLAGRQLHDRRPDERVAERQLFGGLIGVHEAGAFGGSQALSPAIGGEGPDEAQVARIRARARWVDARNARTATRDIDWVR
jgi:hypothetical protein